MRTFFARRVNGRWWVDGVSASRDVAMAWAGYVTLDHGVVVELLDEAVNPIDKEVNSDREQ